MIKTYQLKFGFLLPLVLFSGFASCQKQDASDERDRSIRETMDLPLQMADAHVVKLNQITRSELTQQTTIPEDVTYTDIFKQQDTIPPSIDILIVIDNSYSMEEEQLNLSDKLSALLSDLNEVDWLINVITTDNYCKRIPELPLKPDSPDMEALFQTAVRAGINGSGYEVALKNAMDHLQNKCTSDEPWRRENTDLAILIVSDEDEDTFSDYFEEGHQFLRDLEIMGFTPGTNLKVYGIIGHPDEPCPTANALAVTYAEVIRDSSGLWGSICDADYSSTLQAISRDIRLNLKADFPLRFKPVLSTIRIRLDGNAYAGNWTIVGQRIILADALPEGSTLEIEYQTESFRLIQLGVEATDYILTSVRVNGEEVGPDAYNYDQVSNTVLLTFDPNSGDVIETKLAENKQLITKFPFPPVTPDYITCYDSDDKKMDVEIETKNEKITLTPPLASGKSANCLYTTK